MKRLIENIRIALMLIALLLVTGLMQIGQARADFLNDGITSSDPWLQKPVLPYLLLTKDERLENEAQNLFTALSLSEKEEQTLQQTALEEQQQMQALYTETQEIAGDETLSPSDKEKTIQNTDYNERVDETMKNTDQSLRQLFGLRYSLFRNWIKDWWTREQKAVTDLKQSAGQSGIDSVAYSCWMFATQYFGYTNYEIALPDKYVKFANLGWGIPSPYDGWYANPPYTADIYRNGYWVWGVLVREVGPWNIDDVYWDSATSSPPRRMFSDIPVCWSEAEYAYFYGYNGGQDQFGRTVTVPTSVDLTPSVAADLGLGYLENSYLTIYLYDLP